MMENFFSFTKNNRPVLWGVFVCAFAVSILFIVQWWVAIVGPKQIAKDSDVVQHVQRVVEDEFQTRIQYLLQTAEHAVSDTLLQKNITSGDNEFLSAGIARLEKLYTLPTMTIEIMDSNGAIIAWSGQKTVVDSLYRQLGLSTVPIVKIKRSGLQTYLSVGIPFGRMHRIFVSDILEANYPIANRFITQQSFTGDLSGKLHISLKYSDAVDSLQSKHAIVLNDFHHQPIVTIVIGEERLESDNAALLEQLSRFISLFVAIGLALAAVLIVRNIKPSQHIVIRSTIVIVLIWCVRIGWRYLEFPSALIGGWVFDSAVYASPFICDLTSSLGELTISIAAVFCSVLLIYKKNSRKQFFVKIRMCSIWRRAGFVGISFILNLLLFWLLRGYTIAIRSFVFDSTINFHNPVEILPSLPAILIYLDIIGLTVAVLFVCIRLTIFTRLFLDGILSQSAEWKRWLMYVFMICFSLAVFYLLDGRLVPPWFLILTVIIVSVYFAYQTEQTLSAATIQRQLRIAWGMLAASFIVAIPLLEQSIDEKRDQQLANVAFHLSQPTDNWLSYVLLDGLHSVSQTLLQETGTHSLEHARERHLTFALWTRTMFGREGFNSAVVLYDAHGNEVDRFIVGIDKTEQRTILSKVFEGEEETVQVVPLPGSASTGNHYGAWITIRDTGNVVLANVALLVDDTRSSLFNSEEWEPLRQFTNSGQNDKLQGLAIAEYSHATLVNSSGWSMPFTQQLSSEITNQLQSGTVNLRTAIDGVRYKIIYAVDPSDTSRVVAASYVEPDLRWTLFEFLKIVLVFLVVGLLLLAIHFVRYKRNAVVRIGGFRERLFIAFLFVALLPLIIVGYYNRLFADEKVMNDLSQSVQRELNTLTVRIESYVADEQDFQQGVTDEFCEAMTNEYGMDFSVYGKTTLLASTQSELYRASILDSRLNSNAYSGIVLENKKYVLAKENVGNVQYLVGYAPIKINGHLVGVLAVPTLNRQREMEYEFAQRNAYIFGPYAIVFGLVVLGGGYLASRLARPLKQLSAATQAVGDGNLDVSVNIVSDDEIGDLARSFNEMTQRLRQSRAELAQHERENAWREMAKQVAHEIKNPLTPMKLSVQHLRQAFKDNASAREEILDQVTRMLLEQIESLSLIAGEFSDFAKMPEKRVALFYLHSVIQEAAELFTSLTDVQFQLPESIANDKILADVEQLRRVFINLFRNAVQAMKGKGTITISSVVHSNSIVVRVSDTGSGIPQELLRRIFEPNFSTKTEGMGMGLAITKKIIEDMGGTILCESEYGKGTTFTIQLPMIHGVE
jgi:two-component system, NtrC family, nitrogen regulation sensor histidine kinase NtrY